MDYAYGLFRKGVCFYVGHSSVPQSRYATHRKDPRFAGFGAFDMYILEESLVADSDLEARWVWKMRQCGQAAFNTEALVNFEARMTDEQKLELIATPPLMRPVRNPRGRPKMVSCVRITVGILPCTLSKLRRLQKSQRFSLGRLIDNAVAKL